MAKIIIALKNGSITHNCKARGISFISEHGDDWLVLGPKTIAVAHKFIRSSAPCTDVYLISSCTYS